MNTECKIGGFKVTLNDYTVEVLRGEAVIESMEYPSCDNAEVEYRSMCHVVATILRDVKKFPDLLEAK